MASANELQWNGRKGFYEVYYLKGNSPTVAFWLRYTISVPLKGDPVAELWGIVFEKDTITTCKETFPLKQAGWQKEPFYFQVGEALLMDNKASGQVSGSEGQIRWNMTWVPPAEAYRPYPPLLYRIPFPSTKFVSPGLDIGFSGDITVNGRTYHLDQAVCRGQLAHLWGTRHAERWAWAHCNQFGQERTVFEALSGVPRPNWPHLTLFYFKQGDLVIPLTGWRDWLRNESCYTLDRWTFSGRHGKWRLDGVIDCDPERQMVGVGYKDPDGGSLVCHNTKVADISLKLFQHDGQAWQLDRKLTGKGTCAFEVVEREARLPVRI